MLLIDAVLGDCPLRTLINIASLTWMCIQPCVYYTWITLPKFWRAWCRFDVMVRQHFSNLDDCAIKLIQRVHTSFMQYLSTTNGTHTWFFFHESTFVARPYQKKPRLGLQLGCLCQKKKWNGWNTNENDFNNEALEKGVHVHLVRWCKYTGVDQITAGLYETVYFQSRWSTFWKWLKMEDKNMTQI